MKINEIIREKRKEQNLTQEHIAKSLGISTPAVNKWEKGISYPDITILPTLARLLKIDLNTLLSFQDELSEKEVQAFAKELQDIIQEKGYPFGFQVAKEKMQEFPNCDFLTQVIACTLDSGLLLFENEFVNETEKKKDYKNEIDKLYERISNSQNFEIRDFASGILIHKYIASEQFEKAQILIENYPKLSFNKKQLQSSLFAKQGNYKESAKLLEESLVLSTQETQNILYKLTLTALKENQIESAQYMADMVTKTVNLYDLYPLASYYIHLDIAFHQKNIDQTLKLLKSVLPLMKEGVFWDFTNSPLYKHMEPKNNDGRPIISSQLLTSFLYSLQTDEEYKFISSNPDFLDLIKQYSILTYYSRK